MTNKLETVRFASSKEQDEVSSFPESGAISLRKRLQPDTDEG